MASQNRLVYLAFSSRVWFERDYTFTNISLYYIFGTSVANHTIIKQIGSRCV